MQPSETISEFVSGEPKNYACRLLDGDGRTKTACKVMGITLNYNASKMVNFEVIRDMILVRMGEEAAVNVHTEKKIKRKMKVRGTVSIVTETEDKI
jgi:hypothetical protein